MQTVSFDEKPALFPATQVNGSALKPLTQVLIDRRATPHFRSDPVPGDYLEAILHFASQAPSGYNLQPWRFVVVRNAENRKRLQHAAFDQPKVSEAPVVIVTFATMEKCQSHMDEIFHEEACRSGLSLEDAEKRKDIAARFLDTVHPPTWLNKHSMIAVTTMMLIAEAYGLDTAPMEGFNPEAVKEELALPHDAEVVALLAIGFGMEPDKPYGGRLPLEVLVHDEYYGRRWGLGGVGSTSPAETVSVGN